jgi:sec-independent protein translocase protein TatA
MHLLVVLIVAVLVLGPKKLPEVGRSLGSGIRQFKHSLEGGEQEPAPVSAAPATSAEEAPVEVDAHGG